MADGLILAPIGAIIAASLTGCYATAKLIADKESKISESRQQWINDLRNALSEALGQAQLIAGRVSIAKKNAGLIATKKPAPSRINKNFNRRKRDKSDAWREQIPELEKDLKEHWEKFRISYIKVLLHFNYRETGNGLIKPEHPDPSDKDTSLAEEIQLSSAPSPAVVALLMKMEAIRDKLSVTYDVLADNLKEIEILIPQAARLGNLVIKTEWNKIKEGEPKFKKITSRAFKAAIALIFILFLTILALVITVSDVNKDSRQPPSQGNGGAMSPSAAPKELEKKS